MADLVLWLVGLFVGVALFGNRLLWRVVGVWDFALLNPLGWVAWWDNENCHIEVPAFAGMTGRACWVMVGVLRFGARLRRT